MARIEKRVAADLVYDTRAQPLSAGIRAVISGVRRLLYTTGGTELVLQLTPDREPDRVKLVGQVLDDGMPIEGAAVTLKGPTHCPGEATDEEGEFRLTALPMGDYSLSIEMPTQVIVVDMLDVSCVQARGTTQRDEARDSGLSSLRRAEAAPRGRACDDASVGRPRQNVAPRP